MHTPHQDEHYKKALYELQVELVKLQRDLISSNARVLVILEGRDAAGKDGTIKRLTEHMSPRETRIHAPGKPSSREQTEWYFQRFVPFLPAAQEFVVFNRSWYNRAGVERVMGFAAPEQVQEFLESVSPFEDMLVRDGLALRKYYLDISRKEQKNRLNEREDDPLTQWKVSPIDASAGKKWAAYSRARDEMLRRTSHPAGPWRIVRANDKKVARLEFLRDLLETFSYKGKSKKVTQPDRKIVFPWSEAAAERLEP
ncbi:MAG: polyphosphate kinase 2 [Alphaproteobacteria bacterium]|nr:polyphosphate kinase 2 [Alphaproteobacteria bacterium]MBV9912751.1 polyphosphate kinase 2 [Nevskiaceae bacterium]